MQQIATIEKFSHDGRGIARIDGKTTFIEGALPTERVLFQYTRRKADFDEGKITEIITSSPFRVHPVCPHYTICGGCTLQHLDEHKQIEAKQTLILDVLHHQAYCKPEIILPPLTNKVWHYRNKARLSVRYVEKKHGNLIGFHEKKNSRYVAEINECPVLPAQVSKEISNLKKLLNSFSNPKAIAQIEIAVGDEITALIFRNLTPLTDDDKKKLYEFWKITEFNIFLQPGDHNSIQLLFAKNNSPYLTYNLKEYNIHFKFYPTDFTQINMNLNRLMVNQAVNLMELTSDDTVLDLFCGLGNFSLPMAQLCTTVIGIEINDTMVKRAVMNAQNNAIHNTIFLQQNLYDATIIESLLKFKVSKILLDPPRTGAFELVKSMDLLNVKFVLYISCNPVTLARDANILINYHGYSLKTLGVIDMFPHTAHVESMALFTKG